MKEGGGCVAQWGKHTMYYDEDLYDTDISSMLEHKPDLKLHDVVNFLDHHAVKGIRIIEKDLMAC